MQQHEHCAPYVEQHSAALARIEAKLEAVHDEVARTNGRVTTEEHESARLSAILAAHENMWTQTIKRMDQMEKDMKAFSDFKSSSHGALAGLRGTAVVIVAVLSMLMSMWQTYVSHQALQHVERGRAQQQGQR